MTLTNPGAISNSGSKNFTNQFGTIAKLNYNKQLLADEYQAYQNYTWYALHATKKHQPYCLDCDKSPKKKTKKPKYEPKLKSETKSKPKSKSEHKHKKEKKSKDNFFVRLFKKYISK